MRATNDDMRIGIDFDNTMVCYDELIHRAAVLRGLIPEEVEPTKTTVRDYLRAAGQEEAWIELQGYVYGPGIDQARPFPGMDGFLAKLHRAGAQLFVVSHKTRYPVRGPKCDLHEAARGWLVRHQLLDQQRFGLALEKVFFEETAERKLARIVAIGCSHFIDDSPEFLGQPGFPEEVERILFDPHRRCVPTGGVRRASSWREITSMLNKSTGNGY